MNMYMKLQNKLHRVIHNKRRKSKNVDNFELMAACLSTLFIGKVKGGDYLFDPINTSGIFK